MLTFIAWNNGRKEEGTSVSLSTYASLSYLHESSSNLSLHTNYIKRKEKPKQQRMKTRLNSISAWSSHFQCKYWLFIGKSHTRRIPGRSGEQTLPLTPQLCRGNAAWAAFPRPGCGQVATPCWWVSPGFPSAFIFSWFVSLSPVLWRNGLGFLTLTDRFWEDSSQPVSYTHLTLPTKRIV